MAADDIPPSQVTGGLSSHDRYEVCCKPHVTPKMHHMQQFVFGLRYGGLALSCCTRGRGFIGPISRAPRLLKTPHSSCDCARDPHINSTPSDVACHARRRPVARVSERVLTLPRVPETFRSTRSWKPASTDSSSSKRSVIPRPRGRANRERRIIAMDCRDDLHRCIPCSSVDLKLYVALRSTWSPPARVRRNTSRWNIRPAGRMRRYMRAGLLARGTMMRLRLLRDDLK